jgi:broad specificity phosphatase PhoE
MNIGNFDLIFLIMNVLIIRHGESENNLMGSSVSKKEDYEKARSPDPNLSDIGRE